MEILNLKGYNLWMTVQEGNPDLARVLCIASSFSPHEILISGGTALEELSADVLLYNFCTESITKVDVPSAIKHKSFSKPELTGIGTVVALVNDSDSILHVLKIERQGGEIFMRVEHTLGHHKD